MECENSLKKIYIYVENRSYLDVQIVDCCVATSINERSKRKKAKKKRKSCWLLGGSFVYCRTRKCSMAHICVLLYGMGGGDSASRCGWVPQCGHKRCCLPISRHTIFVSLFFASFSLLFLCLSPPGMYTRVCDSRGRGGEWVCVWYSPLFFSVLVYFFLLYIFLFRQKLILCWHKCILHLDFCRRGDGKNGGG